MPRIKVGKRSTGQLVCAAAIGAVLALPVGYVLGRHSPQPSAKSASEVSSTKNQKMPTLFSPNILSDLAVQDQHRKIVERLELACVQQRLYCEEAASARRWLERREKR